MAIARALLARPNVLIVDKSTSGLDEASAESIAEAVNALRGEVSMLFIAHRVPKGLKVDRHVELKPAGSTSNAAFNWQPLRFQLERTFASIARLAEIATRRRSKPRKLVPGELTFTSRFRA